jgi:hypothetical protein
MTLTAWWAAMVAINAINLVIGIRLALASRISRQDPDYRYRAAMLWMGMTFTLVGAYRSVFVSKYLTQLAWFDSVANSSLLIRGLAFFAEVSFGTQLALAMSRVERDLGGKAQWRKRVPWVLCGCLATAQFFATTGVITKSQLSFAIEESLWSVGFLSVLPLALLQLREVRARDDGSARFASLRRFTRINALWCVVYCLWGVVVNVLATEWPAAIAQLRSGVPALRLDAAALHDAFFVVNPTRAFNDWGLGFLFWHTSYFSICVWISLFLMTAPRLTAPRR